MESKCLEVEHHREEVERTENTMCRYVRELSRKFSVQPSTRLWHRLTTFCPKRLHAFATQNPIKSLSNDFSKNV